MKKMMTSQLSLFIAVFLVFSNVAGLFISFDTIVNRWNNSKCSFPEPSVYTSDSLLEPCKILKDEQQEAYPLCGFFYRTSLSMCTTDSVREKLLTRESINNSPFSKDNSSDKLICTSFALVSKPNSSLYINTDVCQNLCLSTTHSALRPICRALAAAVCIFFGEERCLHPEPEKVLQRKTTESTPPLPAGESKTTDAPVDSKTEAGITPSDLSSVKTDDQTPPEADKPIHKPSEPVDVPSDSDRKEDITTTDVDVEDDKKSDPMPDKTTPGKPDDVKTTPKTDAGRSEIDPDKIKSTSKTSDNSKVQEQNNEKTVKPSPSYVELEGNKNQNKNTEKPGSPPSDNSKVQEQNNEKTVKPSPSYVELEGNKNQNKNTEKPGSPSSIGVEPEGSKVEGDKSSGEAKPSSLNKFHENKNENSAGAVQSPEENEPFSSTDLPTESENSKENEMGINEVDGENKDDDKVSIKTKVNKIADDNKASDTEEEESGSGHFLAYFLTAVVICVSGYIVYHNKQKIMAFIIEGRGGSRGRQRSKGVKYTELKSNVEEVLPSLEKTATVKHFVY